MWTGLFLDLLMYPILLVCYFFTKQYKKEEKGLCFAVTLTGEQMQDVRVKAIGSAYQRQMRGILIFLLILPLPFLFTGSFSIIFLVWTIWFLLIFLLLMLPWAHAHKKLSSLKHEENWGAKLAGTDAEDAYWKWGLCYYNPDRSIHSVETRAGIGTTLNLARPFAGILTVVSIMVLLAMPFFGGFCVAEEFTPVYLKVEQDSVAAGQFRDTYRIPVSSIEDAKLLTDLPRMSKSSGTGLDNLRKGTFYIRNQGKCKALHNPGNQKFLYLKTADQVYYLSDASDDGTIEAYEQIKELQSE